MDLLVDKGYGVTSGKEEVFKQGDLSFEVIGLRDVTFISKGLAINNASFNMEGMVGGEVE